MAESLTDIIPRNIETRIDSVVGLINHLGKTDIDYGHTDECIPIHEAGGAHEVCGVKNIEVSNKNRMIELLQLLLFKDIPDVEYGVEASLKIETDSIRYNALETIAINAKKQEFAENALEQISNIPEKMIDRKLCKYISSILTAPNSLGYYAYFKTHILRNVVGNSKSEAIRGNAFDLILGIQSEQLKSELLKDIFHYDKYKIKECIEAIAEFKDKEISAKQLYHMFMVASMSVNSPTSAEGYRMANKKIGLLFQHLDLFKKELLAEDNNFSLKCIIKGAYTIAKQAYSLLKEIDTIKATEYAAKNARSQLKKEAEAELKEYLVARESA